MSIKINVHFPTTEEGKRELERRIAKAHAQSIVDIINRLDWEPEQKILLFEKVKRTIIEKGDKDEQSTTNFQQ